jgi:hypothetical protein
MAQGRRLSQTFFACPPGGIQTIAEREQGTVAADPFRLSPLQHPVLANGYPTREGAESHALNQCSIWLEQAFAVRLTQVCQSFGQTAQPNGRRGELC